MRAPSPYLQGPDSSGLLAQVQRIQGNTADNYDRTADQGAQRAETIVPSERRCATCPLNGLVSRPS